MFNVLKFKNDEGNKIFFISDLHYHHDKLLQSRGFDSVEVMNKTIITNWNSTVDFDSTVFMLGDLVLGAGGKSKEVYENLIQRLNYKELYLMQGNHFGGGKDLWTQTFSASGIDEFYRLCVKSTERDVYFIPNYYEIVVGKIPIVLSHFPILSWNKQRESYLIFGHCHQSLEKTPWIKENYLTARCLDVSWEGYRRPLSFNEIKIIMDKREPKTFDHH